MSTNDALLQKYKDFSIKYNCGRPATPWQLYRYSVIDKLENLEVREAKKAYDIWNKSFARCLDILPRSKNRMAYYYYWDCGFNIIIITEDYKCGIRVIHDKSEYDKNIYSRLSFEDKSGEKIDKTFDSTDSFGILCNEVISLIDDDYNIFKPLLSAYKYIEDLIDLYYNHITKESSTDRYNAAVIYKVDDVVIWEAKFFDNYETGWKI